MNILAMDTNAFDKLYERLNDDLKSISQNENNIIAASEICIKLILGSAKTLRDAVLTNKFKNKEEEISFFKKTKPNFFSKLIYYSELWNIETRRPTGSYNTQLKYLSKKLDSLKKFFFENIDLYQYYRSNATYLDKEYFLRKQFDMHVFPDPDLYDHDPQFSTSHDYKIARIMANEMIRDYLNNSIVQLEQQKQASAGMPEFQKNQLTWTGSKVALIELTYALQAAGVFNNSKADVKQIAHYMESAFNITLGNYYHTFHEIHARKSGRTQFLDHLKKRLTQRMDEADDNSK